METTAELKIKKGDEIELVIDSVSFGGQGVGRINDFVVFVDGAVTGDRVRVRINKKKKNFAEARTLSVVSPSPYRISPVCQYFGTCGGCRMQDVDYKAQLEIKRLNIQDVFQRIGGFENITIPTPHGSPRIFHYRNKMEFTFGDRAWLTEFVPEEDKPQFVLGMHVPQRFDKVLDINSCHLQSPLATEIVNRVRDFAKQSGLLPYSVKRHDGFWRFLVIRQCEHTNDLMVNIITAEENRKVMQDFADQMLQSFPAITSLIHGVSRKLSQVAFSDQETVLYGKPVITEKLGEYEFEIASDAFFQTNTSGAEILYKTVLDLAELKGHELLYDLYCGTGSIALFLSSHVDKIIGIEWVENAVSNARKNAAHNGISNCEFIHGDMRLALEKLDQRPDVIVVDPPRSGMHEDVIRALLQIDAGKIVYVSCNPATQARDLALLCKEKYALGRIQPVDMFPHTYHIENVVSLSRK